MKSAILVVSFGSTHLDTLESCIVPTEKAIAEAFPEHVFYRAFLSGIVRSRLQEQQEIIVDSVEEAFARMKTDGIEQVLVQPTLLIPGIKYDRLLESIAASANGLAVKVGKPLLSNEADLVEIMNVVRKAYPVEKDTILLTIGHGTAHGANELYESLAEHMREQEEVAMRLCTVEGTPDFLEVVAEVKKLPQRKALLVPLMLVAGDHAKNDMAGDEEDSLTSLLMAAGFQVDSMIKGLGQLKSVHAMYIKLAKTAFESKNIF